MQAPALPCPGRPLQPAITPSALCMGAVGAAAQVGKAPGSGDPTANTALLPPGAQAATTVKQRSFHGTPGQAFSKQDSSIMCYAAMSAAWLAQYKAATAFSYTATCCISASAASTCTAFITSCMQEQPDEAQAILISCAAEPPHARAGRQTVPGCMYEPASPAVTHVAPFL